MACTRNTNNEPLYVYVNALGSDTNPGLRPTQAVKTIGKAIEIAEQYDLTKFGASIFLASGTYTEDITLRETSGGQGVSITSTGSVVLNCRISGTDLVSTSNFTGMTLLQTDPTKPLVTLSNASVTLTNCVLQIRPTSNSSIYPLIAINGALITLSGTLGLIYDGGFSAPGWCYAGAGGNIFGPGLTVATIGSNIWSSGGVYVAAGGVVDLQAMALSDTTRGSLWVVETGGTLFIVRSITSLPGDTIGTGNGTIAPGGIIVGGGTSFANITFNAMRLSLAVALAFPQNRITKPESFESTALWTYTGVTVDTANASSTDLKNDARGIGYPWFDIIKETAVTSIHSVKQLIPIFGQPVVLQIYGKIDGTLTRTKCFVRISDVSGTNTVRAIYDVITGVVSGVTVTGEGIHASSSCTTNAVIGTCLLVCSLPNSGESLIAEYGIASDATTISYLGDISNGILFQGASLITGTVPSGYGYEGVQPYGVVFNATNLPSNAIVQNTGGVLEVPPGVLTTTIGGALAATTSFVITETAGRGCLVTGVAFSVTSGGNSSDLTVSIPFVVGDIIDGGAVELIAISPNPLTVITAKTLVGFISVNYLDINSIVQTVTKSFSVTTVITPTIAGIRARSGGADLPSGNTTVGNFSGVVSFYLWALNCSTTNVLTVTGTSFSQTGSSWTSPGTIITNLIKSGATSTNNTITAEIQSTASTPASTLTVNVTFAEIPGTFTIIFADTA